MSQIKKVEIQVYMGSVFGIKICLSYILYRVCICFNDWWSGRVRGETLDRLLLPQIFTSLSLPSVRNPDFLPFEKVLAVDS